MKKHILISILAVVIGVAIGVPIAVQNASKPVIIRQLSEILQNQKAIEARLLGMERQQQYVFDVVKKIETGAPSAAARQQPPAEDYNKVYEIPVAHSPIKGKKDAPITIVEFIDLQCPFCKRFHPVIDEVLKVYPDKVNYIAKHFPLINIHPQALPASKAAFAAGEQGKYWEMLETLLQNGSVLSEDKFKEVAGNLGLNVKQFMKDYEGKSAQWEEYIKKDLMAGSTAGVRGTPTFYINGRKTRARTLDAFRAEIDRILSEEK